MTDTGHPPPGYYPDPEHPGRHRWWDGSHWATSAPPLSTQAPSPASSPAEPDERSRSIVIAGLVVGSLGVIILALILVLLVATR